MRKTAIGACLILSFVLSTAQAAQKPKPAPHKSMPVKTAAPVNERFTCRSGPTDRQARLVVVVTKGLPQEFAYYSRLGTKVCSIYSKRGDAYTKWADKDGKALVKLLSGNAELDYTPGHLKLIFAEVERMQYCGAYGELDGVIEASRTQTDCVVDGIFDTHEQNDEPMAGEQLSQDPAAPTQPSQNPTN